MVGRMFIVFAVLISANLVVSQSSSKCFFQKTCVECLDADNSCAWCTDENYGMREYRCGTQEGLKASNCSRIETNENYSQLNFVQNEHLRDYDRQRLGATQISPQKIKMQLSKLQPQRFKFTYKPAKNYPLDLYYLMDLTWTMKDDRDTLINMGDRLAKALANLTENYRLGFGSFIDKPAMPFIQTEESRRQNPCSSEREICEPTYGFKHRLQFTNNIESFIEKLKTSSISANLDNLEGGLDALMQVLVCNEPLGWGENTRKIVILATNGYMHMAGDGLLAGITERNDKQCHLSADGDYTGSLVYDYPSLEEIYHTLEKSKKAVIFAVTDELQDYYISLRQLLSEFASVGLLQDDSSNVLQLVSTGYQNFVRKVEFSDDAPDYLQVSYSTTCGGIYKTPQPTSKCDNIEIGQEYDFNVEIRCLDYPSEQISTLKVKIEEKLISNEAIELEIDLRQVCQCEKDQAAMEASNHCNGQGTYSCGMCNCYAGWIGKTCECDLQTFESSVELLNQCRAESEFDELGPICSDRGECICGLCLCIPGFEGPHCECPECVHISGVLCSNHGECDCGECKCTEGWQGDQCDCSTDTSTCIAPHKNELCSGRGDCSCGRCLCGETFYGPFCEVTAGAESELCSYYEDCVRCAVHKRMGKQCVEVEQQCKEKLGLYSAEFHTVIEDKLICTARITHEDVTYDFKYTYQHENRQTNLMIQDQNFTRVNTVAAFFSIAAFTLVLGLVVLLVLKVKMLLEDRRMYKKFEEEQKTETFYQMDSPLYKSPITKFNVPAEMADSELR